MEQIQGDHLAVDLRVRLRHRVSNQETHAPSVAEGSGSRGRKPETRIPPIAAELSALCCSSSSPIVPLSRLALALSGAHGRRSSPTLSGSQSDSIASTG
jgi:hypothetical protein